jgi:NAD(P)-dependent dehydrogenase (short-subunit alcohol dehydrogenase family)
LSAVVFGGYGTFGSLVCRELARMGTRVTVAGRDRLRAEALAAKLGPGARGLEADVRDGYACRAALASHEIAVCCAGPFASLGSALLDACLEAGCHYVDIAEDRSHAARVRGYGDAFRERGRAAVYGASSLPGLSGALAQLIRTDAGATPPARARVTLFIGNASPKGRAAVQSAVARLGKPVAAPQGTLRGFGEREVVALPPPFGARAVYTFDSPEYDLLPGLVGVSSVAVKVGFERRAATAAFALFARLGSGHGAGLARLLSWLGSLTPGGTSGGVVQVELFWQDGTVRRAALVGDGDGQRMAAQPCVLAVRALDGGSARARGALTAYELLGARALVGAVTAAGYRLVQ